MFLYNVTESVLTHITLFIFQICKESSSETHKIIGHPGKANVEWEDGNKLLSFNLKSVALLQSCECLKGCMNE